jgi:hypothetical protein
MRCAGGHWRLQTRPGQPRSALMTARPKRPPLQTTTPMRPSRTHLRPKESPVRCQRDWNALRPTFPTACISVPLSASPPLGNPSILISPSIGGQNLSPEPLPPCLQWVTSFLHSWLRCGSRIPGCPRPGARQIAVAPVRAPSILSRQTRSDGCRGLLSPFPGGGGHP